MGTEQGRKESPAAVEAGVSLGSNLGDRAAAVLAGPRATFAFTRRPFDRKLSTRRQPHARNPGGPPP